MSMNNKVILTVCLVIVTAAGLYKFTHQPCMSCSTQHHDSAMVNENTEMDYMLSGSPKKASFENEYKEMGEPEVQQPGGVAYPGVPA